MPVLRIAKDLAYYPRKSTFFKLKQAIEFLAGRKDKIKAAEVCQKFKISRNWLERLDTLGLIRLESKYIGYGSEGHYHYPAVYFVKINNFKKAQKIFKKALIKPEKVVSNTDIMADRLMLLLENQEKGDSNSS